MNSHNLDLDARALCAEIERLNLILGSVLEAIEEANLDESGVLNLAIEGIISRARQGEYP